MTETPDLVAPFPLLRRFLVYVVPGLALTILGILLVVSQALSTTVERLYQREAVAKQRLIVTAISATDRNGWLALVRSGATDGGAFDRILEELASETQEMSFDCSAIRAPSNRMLVTTNADGCIGSDTEVLMPLEKIGDAAFAETRGDKPQWVVASLVRDPIGGDPIVVVTRQDAAKQEGLIGTSAAIWLGLLGMLFTLILTCAIWLVRRAQSEIVARTAALNEARHSLARFVSRHGQARAAAGDERGAAARRLEATVLFIDIRDFSSFAETATPEAAVALVETIASIAFERILAAGGDVDRLLGDGLVAWFEGADRRERAWRAVAGILPMVSQAQTPRGVAAGLHDGDLVEATIGAGERLDHTVLGRTVNVAARLCAVAAVGEVLVSADMGEPPFGIAATSRNEEELSLKGLARPVRCLRWSGLKIASGAPIEAARHSRNA